MHLKKIKLIKFSGFTPHLIKNAPRSWRRVIFSIFSPQGMTPRGQGAGFTLIELLVVISIIGLLSSFAIVSLNDARIKARDALRKGDMAQLRTALNIYYDDNGRYPICGIWVNDPEEDYGATNDCYNNQLTSDLTINPARPYIDKTPKDPRNQANLPAPEGNSTYIYKYVSDGNQYAIVYSLEFEGEKIIRGW